MVQPGLLGPTHNSHQAREQNFPSWGPQTPTSPWVGFGGITMSWDWAAVLFVGGSLDMLPSFAPPTVWTLTLQLHVEPSMLAWSYPNSSIVIFSLVLRAILLTYYLNNCGKGIVLENVLEWTTAAVLGYQASPCFRLSSDSQKGP